MFAPLGDKRVHCWSRVGGQRAASVQAHFGALKDSHVEAVSCPRQTSAPHPRGCRPGHLLYHGVEGTVAVAAAPREHLRGWGVPTLGWVGGYKQGAAAVGRVFQVCQRCPWGQRLLQVLRQHVFATTVACAWRAGLCWLKGIIVCRVVEDAVWVDGGLVGWWRVIRLVEIWVLVSGVGRWWVMEVERSAFPVIRKMERCEACAKTVWTVIKARDPPAQVEVVQVCPNQGLDAFPAPLAQSVDHKKQQ